MQILNKIKELYSQYTYKGLGFEKYQHLERLGTQSVEGILDGECSIFPKLDGSNASVWYNDKNCTVECGSRNMKLGAGNTLAGFYDYIQNNEAIKQYLLDNPTFRLYGEWLVPHSIKEYNADAFKQFYVFDVICNGKYVDYDDYHTILNYYGINYIPRITKVVNPTKDYIVKLGEQDSYLIKESSDIKSEGVVIKNYNFTNKYGRVCWAKQLHKEFKNKLYGQSKSQIEIENKVEYQIIDKFLSDDFIKKEYEKIKLVTEGQPRGVVIARVLSQIEHVFYTEESVHFIRKLKKPIVNFRILSSFILKRIKETLTELF